MSYIKLGGVVIGSGRQRAHRGTLEELARAVAHEAEQVAVDDDY